MVLAFYYTQGKGVAQDFAKAAYYLELATENGQRGFQNARIEYSKGKMKYEVGHICRYLAEQQNLAVAQYQIGCDKVAATRALSWHENGAGYYKEALKYFELAAQQGYRDAKEKCKEMLSAIGAENSRQIDEYMEEAMSYLKSAANLGSEEAQQILEYCEEQGFI